MAGYDRAVNIGKLEAYCTDWQRHHEGLPNYQIAPSSGRRVAIVGSGPAGMSAAEELMRDGHTCVVYEEWPKPGGLNVYGIPGFKLYKQIIAEKVEWLERYGVRFVCNTQVGKDVSLQTLMHEYDSVFLAIGAPLGNQARLSTDAGKSWSAPLTISDDGVSHDLGYPSTVELADSSLLTVWYEQKKDSPRAVLRQACWNLT